MMQWKKPCNLMAISLAVAVMLLSGNALAAGEIYLVDASDNDSAFVTTGIGTEFELRLMADDNLLGFHLYLIDILYDKTILDTVEISDDNSLFQNHPTAGQIIFGSYLREDSTILRIQSMLFGAGLSVDGPGLLATIRLKAIGTGVVDMAIDSIEVRDVYNDLMAVDAEGATVLIDVPPSEFNLISPVDEEQITVLITDDLHLEWGEAITPYPGDFVRYELLYGSDPTFATNTTSVGDLVDTWIDIPAVGLDVGLYYWKVRAYGTYGFETWSNQTDWYFDLVIEGYPGNFNLIFPEDASLINIITGNDINLDWDDPASQIPDDTITYTVYFGPDAGIPGTAYYDDEIKDVSEIIADAGQLPYHEWVYWNVNAENRLGYSRMSDNMLTFMSYYRGDTDADGEINILDIVYLINFKYKEGPEPDPWVAGDVNCDLEINILDVVYLINFKYKDGPPPCAD
jgi:hypothetical protein